MSATLDIDYAADPFVRLPVRTARPRGAAARARLAGPDDWSNWRPMRAFRPLTVRLPRRPRRRPAFTVDGALWRVDTMKVMASADARDIEATLAGDPDAFGRIVERYQQDVGRRLWRFTRDRRQLEELVEEVFVQAWRGLSGYRGESPLLHWLQRIATRTGYRFWKRRDRRADRELPLQDWDEPIDDPPEAALEAAEAAEKLHRLLAELPPRDRLVLTLMYVEELSVAETAEQTGWSQTMVKVQAHRARKKLRVLLEKSARPDR